MHLHAFQPPASQCLIILNAVHHFCDAGVAARASAAMEKVDFGSGFGYEVGPKNAPSVVVIQEWWGELGFVLCPIHVASSSYK